MCNCKPFYGITWNKKEFKWMEWIWIQMNGMYINGIEVVIALGIKRMK